MAQVISISNFKGGTGKSTSVMNIGAGLAKKKKNVLLIDIDPQHNLTQGLGIKKINKSVYDCLVKEDEIKPIELKKNLSVVPSSIELIKAEIELSSLFKREYILQKKLDEIKEGYDFILIDCPPSLGLLTVNGLMASDLFFVPVEPEIFALNGLNVFKEALNNLEIDIDNILITKYDGRTILHKNVVKAIENFMPGKTFKSIIRKNITVAEAVTVNEDVFEYDKECNGAIDYKNLTNEIIKLYN